MVLEELSRWELSAEEVSDPLAHLESVLAGHRDPELLGYGVLLSHAACVRSLLSPAGWGATAAGRVGSPASSPVTSVPDLVVVGYRADSLERREEPAPGSAKIVPLGHAQAWRSSWSPAQHAGAVEEVRRRIGLGEVYQVNLVSHSVASGDPHSVAWAVSRLGARHGGSMVGDGWSVHSASPELALQLAGSMVGTEPIKGTSSDAAALRRSAKDRAEHVMIVDLERNDLARVARTGSVRVPQLYDIRAWSGLQHAHSSVTAELRDGVGLADLLRAVLPGGSVTGAPKSSALRTLHELEPVGRGPSMGAMGWISATGEVELALTIRTVACDHVSGDVHLWAGGGITWDSTGEGEVAEAAAKAAPIMSALEPYLR